MLAPLQSEKGRGVEEQLHRDSGLLERIVRFESDGDGRTS